MHGDEGAHGYWLRYRRFTVRALLVAAFVFGGWGLATAQESPKPTDPGYIDAKIDLLLEAPAPDYVPDQMYRLLLFIWGDSMGRAGELAVNPALQTDKSIQADLIAETGVWDAVYRTIVIMPLVSDPSLGQVQYELTDAVRLSTVAGANLRDSIMRDDQESFDRSVMAFNEMSGIIGGLALRIDMATLGLT